MRFLEISARTGQVAFLSLNWSIFSYLARLQSQYDTFSRMSCPNGSSHRPSAPRTSMVFGYSNLSHEWYIALTFEKAVRMLTPKSFTGEADSFNVLRHRGWIHSESSSRLLNDCQEHG